jgi:3-hydroxyisobutyrate dehydrogenase-like beta-hydroxyacid dehydrogenase
MGSAMASRLLDRGLSLAVYNRTAARPEPLRIRGAEVVACPSEVGRRASVIITCVTDDEAVGQVLLGPDGVLQGAAPGTILLETSTIGPDASAGFAPACAAAGVAYLRAPIWGSVAHAATGSLAFLVSGPRHAFGLVLGEKAGLDWRSMLEVFETSAVASPLVRNKLRTLVERDFAPGAATRLLAKRLRADPRGGALDRQPSPRRRPRTPAAGREHERRRSSSGSQTARERRSWCGAW